MKDHDLHLWLTAEDYAWVARQAREQDRSKNSVITRLIRRARAESMDDEPDCARDTLGAACPAMGYRS
jgi:hypothetical protein